MCWQWSSGPYAWAAGIVLGGLSLCPCSQLVDTGPWYVTLNSPWLTSSFLVLLPHPPHCTLIIDNCHHTWPWRCAITTSWLTLAKSLCSRLICNWGAGVLSSSSLPSPPPPVLHLCLPGGASNDNVALPSVSGFLLRPCKISEVSRDLY